MSQRDAMQHGAVPSRRETYQQPTLRTNRTTLICILLVSALDLSILIRLIAVTRMEHLSIVRPLKHK